MVVVAGCRDVPLRSGRRGLVIVASPGEHRRPRDIEGCHPGRCSCVRNVETPSGSGSCWRAGKPTVRNAQFLGGNRMTKKRMPAAETQRETTGAGPAPPAGRRGQPAGYRDSCPDAKAR